MVTIIHGEDNASSRKYYIEQRQQSKNPQTFLAEDITASDMIQALDGSILFEEKISIFIENLLSGKQAKSKETKDIIQLLNNYEKKTDIFLWESKELTKATLSVFKNATNKLFKIPQTMFAFLDSLKPNTGKFLVKQFHQALIATETELIFFMLMRQFRLLLALSDINCNEQIDEVNRLAPWQKGKLEKQARLFTQDKLKQTYNKLFEIDLSQKIGTSSLSLIQAIDFFLLEI